MNRVSVQSSNLDSVGYDPNSQILEIAFNDGSVYQYSGVPSSVHQDLMSAASKGGYADDFVYDQYSSTKIR